MPNIKQYRFESLIDASVLNKNQRELINYDSENQACDPCTCDASDCNCRCN